MREGRVMGKQAVAAAWWEFDSWDLGSEVAVSHQ